jgi:hypothetical protein
MCCGHERTRGPLILMETEMATKPLWLKIYADRFGLYDKNAVPIYDPMTHQKPDVADVDAFRDRAVAKLRALAEDARIRNRSRFDLTQALRADAFDAAADLVLSTPSQDQR